MALDSIAHFLPVYLLVLFRIAGMMLYAPLLGSARVPRRVKGLLAIITAMGIAGGVPAPAVMPQTPWGLALGIGGEMIFGLAMGMILSFIFISVQWAGQIISQQMGLNMAEVIDPQLGGGGSIVGDMYFLFTLVLFLLVGGHREMLRGVRDSFDALPLLSVGMNRPLLDMIVGLLLSSTVLAMRLAAPVLVTMLVADLTLGFIGKTMPQFNVMTAGLSLKTMLGIIVLMVGFMLGSTPNVMIDSLRESVQNMRAAWPLLSPG